MKNKKLKSRSAKNKKLKSNAEPTRSGTFKEVQPSDNQRQLSGQNIQDPDSTFINTSLEAGPSSPKSVNIADLPDVDMQALGQNESDPVSIMMENKEPRLTTAGSESGPSSPNQRNKTKQPDTDIPDYRLHPRLFATDRFPCKWLNIYSSSEILAFIRHVFRGTRKFEIIKESGFGKLFDLPARQCPVSFKLIHSLLTRQVVDYQKYTLCPVFRRSSSQF
ncbi:hypothetical protein Bca101_057479 [Brassica carinata]